jgi:hypothetical protein
MIPIEAAHDLIFVCSRLSQVVRRRPCNLHRQAAAVVSETIRSGRPADL